MKCAMVLIILSAVLTASCALSGRLSSEIDEAAGEGNQLCGDGVCDDSENLDLCSEDCPQVEEGTSSAEASWLNPVPDCRDVRESSVLSEGSPWAFSAEGTTTELLPDGSITCVLRIQICGDEIFKQQVVAEGEGCPASLHYSSAPPAEICCSDWVEAKESGPCDPLEDADCDGIHNDADDWPLDPAG